MLRLVDLSGSSVYPDKQLWPKDGDLNAADRFGPKMAIQMISIVLAQIWRFECCRSFCPKYGDLNAADCFGPKMAI